MAKRVTEKRSVKEAQQKKGKHKRATGSGKRLGNFFKRLKNELKKVTWPDRLQLKRTSAVSFAIIICVVLLIFFSDSILRGLLSIGGFNKPTKEQGAAQAPAAVTEQVQESATTTVAVAQSADGGSGETNATTTAGTAEK